jgi:hypothetical protein
MMETAAEFRQVGNIETLAVVVHGPGLSGTEPVFFLAGGMVTTLRSHVSRYREHVDVPQGGTGNGKRRLSVCPYVH